MTALCLRFHHLCFLFVVVPIGVVQILEDTTFDDLDETPLGLVLPNLNVLGRPCRGSTVRQINGDLWLCCAL